MRTVLGNKGFTLIEAMVALTIFTLGIVALSKLLQVSLYYDRISSQQRNADLIAAEISEELKGLVASSNTYGSSVLNLQSYTLTDPTFVQSSMSTSPPNCTGNCVQSIGKYSGFNYQWRVDNGQGASTWPTNMWRIYVTVGWVGGNANPQYPCTPGSDPSTCPYTTKMTNFLVPATTP